jgi:hypothetical protein
MWRNIFRLILRPVSALSLVFSMMSVVVVAGVLAIADGCRYAGEDQVVFSIP